MVEFTSNFATWKSVVVTLLIILAGVFGLILNILFIFVISRSRFLRRPANLFLLNIAIIDIVGVVFWIIPSIIASSTWKWYLGQAVCEIHGFVGMFCFSQNMYTFTVMAFEKFIKLLFPSKHRYAFENYTIVLVVIFALWFLCVVLAFMPLIGWSEFLFYNYQVQCAADFILSDSLLNFFVVVVLIFPTVTSAVLYVIIFVKVKRLNKKKTTKDGKFVLQERKEAAGDSYAEKMKAQQSKFKVNKASNSDSKKKKSKNKKNKKSDDIRDEGYDSDKCFHSDDSDVVEVSDEEYFQDYEDYHRKKREKEMRKERKKIFTFKEHYFFMAITMIITMAIYVALWTPFYVLSYIWVFYPSSVQEGSYVFFTAVTFFGLSYKPLIYLTNRQVRASFVRAFHCRRKKKIIYGGDGDARDETSMTETRTVREVHHTEEVVETTTTTRTYSDERVEHVQPTVAWEETQAS